MVGEEPEEARQSVSGDNEGHTLESRLGCARRGGTIWKGLNLGEEMPSSLTLKASGGSLPGPVGS